MPEINSATPGNFCWLELATTDQAAAKSFYENLFGWTANDFPMGPSEFYTMFLSEGRDAGAAFTLNQEMLQQGVPPNWTLHISVLNADETAAKIKQAGGRFMKEPFDVFDSGRMAVFADPTGAVACIWQPGKHFGFGVSGEENSFCWADLSTPDPEKAKAFYEAVFGWKISAAPNDPSGYLHIQNGDQFIGGVPPARMRRPNDPPHWLIYFQTSDCDASAAKAESHAAKILAPPMSVPHVGRICIVADPQGAVFALFEPQDAA